MPVPKDWMTRKELAVYLGISLRTVTTLISTGRLQTAQLRPGGAVRIPAESIERLLESMRRGRQ